MKNTALFITLIFFIYYSDKYASVCFYLPTLRSCYIQLSRTFFHVDIKILNVIIIWYYYRSLALLNIISVLLKLTTTSISSKIPPPYQYENMKLIIFLITIALSFKTVYIGHYNIQLQMRFITMCGLFMEGIVTWCSANGVTYHSIDISIEDIQSTYVSHMILVCMRGSIRLDPLQIHVTSVYIRHLFVLMVSSILLAVQGGSIAM